MYQRRYHVLVADDDMQSLHHIVELLKRRDYVVAGAPTMGKVRWWLKQWPTDLIIASYRFCSTTGLQLILSARNEHPDIAGMIISPLDGRLDDMDAWRHRVQMIGPPREGEEFLMTVAERLASIKRRQRWPRKTVTSEVPIAVGEIAGELMDVSYGGLRFRLTSEIFPLTSPLQIDFPAARLSVQAELVWSARGSDGRSCVVGAAVTQSATPPSRWRTFVDRVS